MRCSQSNRCPLVSSWQSNSSNALRIESRSIASCEKLCARYEFDIFAGSVSSKIASGRTFVEPARIFHYIRRIFAYRRRRAREAKTPGNVSYSSCDRCKLTSPRPNLEIGRTVSLNYSPGFRGCEKLAVKVTHNVTVVEIPCYSSWKKPVPKDGLSWSTIACFVILYPCELHPSNRLRDCAHHPWPCRGCLRFASPCRP